MYSCISFDVKEMDLGRDAFGRGAFACFWSERMAVRPKSEPEKRRRGSQWAETLCSEAFGALFAEGAGA